MNVVIAPEAPTTLPPGHLNIMGYVQRSEVNGPGCRAVVWVQGCRRRCPGCFNPDSWSFAVNQTVAVETLAEDILRQPCHQGVTFSGGEPFWQAAALAQLAALVKAAGLNVMAFSGFTLEELQAEGAPPDASALLAQLDLLVDGPYLESLALHSPNSPVASRNQRVHLFNPSLGNAITWSSDQLEVHIFKDGSRIVTGYYGHLDRDDLAGGKPGLPPVAPDNSPLQDKCTIHHGD